MLFLLLVLAHRNFRVISRKNVFRGKNDDYKSWQSLLCKLDETVGSIIKSYRVIAREMIECSENNNDFRIDARFIK